MKIIFMGTPDFSAEILETLLQSSHEILSVYTQPPKPIGRGLKVKKSAVHELAERNDIEVQTPQTLRTLDSVLHFKSYKADVAIVVAYGLILPKTILEATRFGCINIHASLLPRWRGAAPIQRAIENGDETTGLTYMQMDEGMDTGDILKTFEIAIPENITSPCLFKKLCELSKASILSFLEAFEAGKCMPVQQNHRKATYASKLTRDESIINWNLSAFELDRKRRAFQPWPGQKFTYQNMDFKILDAEVEPSNSGDQIKPGIIYLNKNSMKVATSEGFYKITKIQPHGKKPLEIKDFLNGQTIFKNGLNIQI